MSVDNYDFVLEGGTCSLKYSLEPVAFYWRFLTLGNRRGNENRRQWIAPLSGHVSSDGCARRGSHKALTASPSSVPRSSSAAATRRMPRRPQPVLANQAAERRRHASGRELRRRVTVVTRSSRITYPVSNLPAKA